MRPPAPALTLEPAAPAIGRWNHDDATIAAVREDGRARVAVHRVAHPVVVLGSGSDERIELDLDACRADGVPIVRRRGGGCAVVIDPGNVVLCAALPVEGLGGIRSHFDWISAWLAARLADAGVAGVSQEGVSDLAIDGRKFGGSCIHRAKDLLTYSVTMLVEGDVSLIERYLRHPPREPAYRAGRLHRDFVLPLARHVPGLTAAALESALAARATPQDLASFPRPPAREYR